jgi:hypothetical protein
MKEKEGSSRRSLRLVVPLGAALGVGMGVLGERAQNLK